MSNKPGKLAASFRCAAEGIAYTIKTQRNFRFHIVAAVWVTIASFFYDFTAAEYCIILLTFSSVMAAEAINTAIEKTVDLCTDKIKPLAKVAKDAAAGAVLITAIFAAIIAVILFADAEVLGHIADFADKNPIADMGAVILAAVSVIFIFHR